LSRFAGVTYNVDDWKEQQVKAKATMKQPEDMTLDELRPYMAEFLRRQRSGKPTTPPILKPCRECSEMLTARQRRYPCPKCGARNRNLAIAEVR
jgi:NADH pyrophosphatase NudC (nudix superfamily)